MNATKTTKIIPTKIVSICMISLSLLSILLLLNNYLELNVTLRRIVATANLAFWIVLDVYFIHRLLSYRRSLSSGSNTNW